LKSEKNEKCVFSNTAGQIILTRQDSSPCR